MSAVVTSDRYKRFCVEYCREYRPYDINSTSWQSVHRRHLCAVISVHVRITTGGVRIALHCLTRSLIPDQSTTKTHLVSDLPATHGKTIPNEKDEKQNCDRHSLDR